MKLYALSIVKQLPRFQRIVLSSSGAFFNPLGLLDLKDECAVNISQSIFFMALRPNAGHGLLILEVSRSHTTTRHSR
jgi:hypothetical protein